MSLRRWEAFARDVALQCIAVSILPWPVDHYLWNFPQREKGLALGFVIGLGNALRWASIRNAGAG